MSSHLNKDKKITVSLRGDSKNINIMDPTEEQIFDLVSAPEKYNRYPFSEDVTIQSNQGGYVVLYFDHKGKVYFFYEGRDSAYSMKDLTNPSKEILRLFHMHSDNGWVHENCLVHVEVALPFLLEFCRTGEINTSNELWEKE